MEKSGAREREIPKALLKWYAFHTQDSVLYIGDPLDAIYEGLKEMCQAGEMAALNCVSAECVMNGKRGDTQFDVVIISECFETCENPDNIFSKASMCLKPNGRLIVCANNRFGVRYFCGDRDPYTNRNFDSIENYRKAVASVKDEVSGRMYDKITLRKMLQKAGFVQQQFYSVFPGLENPTLIFADGYEPNEELNIRCVPMYHNPDTVFLEEEYLYTGLIQNHLFHTMANAFIIICSKQDSQELKKNVLQVTASVDRGKEDAFFTIIYDDQKVEKRAVYQDGKRRLEKLIQNGADLESRGIHMVPAHMEGEAYVMPYVQAESAITYFRRLAYLDKDKFIQEMDRFCEVVLYSSEIYTDELNGVRDRFFRNGYYDLVPLNCFVVEGEFVFYDQEFVIENCPVGVIVSRLVDLVYQGESNIEKSVPRKEFLVRYGIDRNIDTYRSMAWKYVVELRKEDDLRLYYEKTRRNAEIVEANRKRMNYSQAEYERIFADALYNLGDRSLILFGSGEFTRRFLSMYGKEYPVSAIVDNNPDRWGDVIAGITVQSPEILQSLDKRTYKVFICIKNYLSVVRQLEKLGITEYGIFDSNRSYAKKMTQTYEDMTMHTDEVHKRKKYHVGYVAGVFDMFHIGHVRLLQRAKEQCEYLIVGVVSDEDCYRQKMKYPIIPCSERVEVLKSCRYVDQVEALPTGFGGIRDAYKMFQFDVQFSGNDHGDEGSWLAEKEYLNKQGVDLVFFDYTKETSSTEIRKKMQ